MEAYRLWTDLHKGRTLYDKGQRCSRPFRGKLGMWGPVQRLRQLYLYMLSILNCKQRKEGRLNQDCPWTDRLGRLCGVFVPGPIYVYI